MENQDKIFEEIKATAQKAESKEFPAMEKVWSRVEEKLDKKDDRKAIALWKKIAVAASLLLLLTLGYQFLKDEKQPAPIVNPENTVVHNETRDSVKPDKNPVVESETPKSSTPEKHPSVKPNADKILRKAIRKQQQTAVVESDKQKDVSVAEPDFEIISGTVSDNTGVLPGANVIVKGTANVTQTDIDGKYKIRAKKGDELVFSFVGMSEANAIIAKETSINMQLTQGVALNEVVIEGYKTVAKKKSSMAYSTIRTESITVSKKGKKRNSRNGDKSEEVSTPTAAAPYNQTLQSQVAGLNINTTSAHLGKTEIVLRGNNTLESGKQPLYVIDGVVATEKQFKELKPDDIQSITVLKDASATAIYGIRASDGALVITSKGAATSDTISKQDAKKLKRLLKKLKKNPQSDVEQPKSSIEISQEDYDFFIENPFESPKQAPLSTFSIDVDNASYTNVRRFINSGQTVPKDAVRVEEMINFFKYEYPQPQDKHPFSINTEYSSCPWNPNHKLLKIGLQGKNIPTGQLPASNLVFLIDVSGSMSDENKLPLLKQSMKVLVGQLRKEDKVSIVVYAGAAGMVLPPTSGADKATIIAALDNLNAGGSTAGGAGIELAYKTAQENFVKGGNNRVILATDGDFNVGMSSNGDMETLIKEKRKSGVFLTCLGYGMGNYKDSKMEILADKGNGNYAYIDNIQEANRFLGKEFKGSMFAIAKDVKIQIEFNPKHVQAYRLIGYENRKLRPEDFTDDKIDAGELGSGHTVTALYEIVPTGVKSDFYNESPQLKYTQAQSSGNFNDELATVKFRYKKPDGDTSIEMVKVIEDKPVPIEESSEDFKFSAAVAWFGLKLRDSKLIGNKKSEDIITLAKQGKSNDAEGYKAEFIRLVEAVK